MFLPLIFDDRAASDSRVPSQSGQVVKVTARSTNARMCGCMASTSLARNDFLICGIRPAYVRLMPSTLILVGSLWSRSFSSFLVYLLDRLVRVEEAAAVIDPAVPALHAVAGDGQRTIIERLGVVVERGQVDVGHRAAALAARAHAAGDAEASALLDGLAGAFQRDRARSADRGDVEGERLRRADVRFTEPAEQDSQHRAGVGGCPDGGAGVGTHALLVDDDRGGQPLQDVDVGPRQRSA